MLATLRKRFDREDEGFTLIELMVVVLIIAAVQRRLVGGEER